MGAGPGRVGKELNMPFIEKLQQTAVKANSIACMGMDPEIERIPVRARSKEEKIVKFYTELLEQVSAKIAAVKPNYAFFAQYGFEGLNALKNVIVESRKRKLLVILDAKRGDIGKSSAAYAKEAFDFWGADAVTVAPYMGWDSIAPFAEYCRKGKGVYVLAHTSNPGAEDLQHLKTGMEQVYEKTCEMIARNWQPGVCAVAGATYIEELRKVQGAFSRSGKKVPLLVPGVGTQGANAAQVAQELQNKTIHRINSSSAINYAYEKYKTTDYAGAALRAVDELNREIGRIS